MYYRSLSEKKRNHSKHSRNFVVKKTPKIMNTVLNMLEACFHQPVNHLILFFSIHK